MKLLILTGMSGAGKSTAFKMLEDLGYYCVDNLPIPLLKSFIDLSEQPSAKEQKLVVGIDIRSGESLHLLQSVLSELRQDGKKYSILFLDAEDEVLVKRYKETRRNHPLSGTERIQAGIIKERAAIGFLKEEADYIIDTTHLSAAQLKERISNIFLDNVMTGMLINCTSFGFKYGPATEADLVFDVRCLPNPFYVDELKKQTGLDQPVRDYVMKWPQSIELLNKIVDLVDFLIPYYLDEGKSQLVIAFGCTGGKHRSVTFAEYLYKHLSDKGHKVTVNHRDILKN